MNVDKSAALIVVIVAITVGRSTNDENTMDDEDAKQHRVLGEGSQLLRHRPRSASIGHLTTISTEHVRETQDHRKQHYHVASFDFSFVSTPFTVSLWIILSSVAKIGQLTACRKIPTRTFATCNSALRVVKVRVGILRVEVQVCVCVMKVH